MGTHFCGKGDGWTGEVVRGYLVVVKSQPVESSDPSNCLAKSRFGGLVLLHCLYRVDQWDE